MRVATQLIEVQSGRLLWSKTTQVTLNDIFQLQDDLTRQIVDSLSLPLSAREQRMLSHDAPATARSDQYYLRANELASDPRRGGSRAISTSRRSMKIPVMRPPGRGCGGLLRRIGKVGAGSSDDLVRAEAALRRALELNPDLPLAHNLTAQLDIDGGRARDAMVNLTLRSPPAAARIRSRLPGSSTPAETAACSARPCERSARPPPRTVDQDLGRSIRSGCCVSMTRCWRAAWRPRSSSRFRSSALGGSRCPRAPGREGKERAAKDSVDHWCIEGIARGPAG